MTTFIRYQAPNGTPIYLNPDYLISFQYIPGGMSKMHLAKGPEEYILISDNEAISVAHQLQALGLIVSE